LKISFSANLNSKQIALASSNIPIPWLHPPDTLPGSSQSIVQKNKERKKPRIHFKQRLKATLANTFKGPYFAAENLKIYKTHMSVEDTFCYFYLTWKWRYCEILSEN